jgi:DNA helicase INO80
MLDIDNGEKSDVEGPGFENEMQVYREKGRKRLVESYRSEQISRKVF